MPWCAGRRQHSPADVRSHALGLAAPSAAAARTSLDSPARGSADTERAHTISADSSVHSERATRLQALADPARLSVPCERAGPEPAQPSHASDSPFQPFHAVQSPRTDAAARGRALAAPAGRRLRRVDSSATPGGGRGAAPPSPRASLEAWNDARRARDSLDAVRPSALALVSRTLSTTRVQGRRVLNGRYVDLRPIGRGQYGQVRLCLDLHACRLVAIKLCSRAALRSSSSRLSLDSRRTALRGRCAPHGAASLASSRSAGTLAAMASVTQTLTSGSARGPMGGVSRKRPAPGGGDAGQDGEPPRRRSCASSAGRASEEATGESQRAAGDESRAASAFSVFRSHSAAYGGLQLQPPPGVPAQPAVDPTAPAAPCCAEACGARCAAAASPTLRGDVARVGVKAEEAAAQPQSAALAFACGTHDNSAQSTATAAPALESDAAAQPRTAALVANATRPHGSFAMSCSPHHGSAASLRSGATDVQLGGRGSLDRCRDGSAAQAERPLLAEARILRQLRHRNVVHLHAVVDDPAADDVALVMEYVSGGTLEQPKATFKSNRWQTVPEATVRSWVEQAVCALEYLGEQGIAHGDVKPANLLLASDGTVKLADFGGACSTAPSHDVTEPIFGTPAFRAPESLLPNYTLQPPVDVWALGVCMFVWLFGWLPFDGATPYAIYNAIRTAPVAIPGDPAAAADELGASHCSPHARSFLSALLGKDPAQRMTPQAMRKHPWLASHCAASPPRDAGGRHAMLRASCTRDRRLSRAAAVTLPPGGPACSALVGRPLRSFEQHAEAVSAEDMLWEAAAGGDEDAAMLSSMHGAFREVRLASGERIFARGASVECVYLIVSGEVALSGMGEGGPRIRASCQGDREASSGRDSAAFSNTVACLEDEEEEALFLGGGGSATDSVPAGCDALGMQGQWLGVIGGLPGSSGQRSCASRSRSPRRPALSCGPGDGLGFAAVDVLRPACDDAAANPPSVMHEHAHSSLRNARQPPPALSRSRFCQPAAPLTGYDGRLAEVCVASGGAATWACEARACSDLVLLRAELEQVAELVAACPAFEAGMRGVGQRSMNDRIIADTLSLLQLRPSGK